MCESVFMRMCTRMCMCMRVSMCMGMDMGMHVALASGLPGDKLSLHMRLTTHRTIWWYLVDSHHAIGLTQDI